MPSTDQAVAFVTGASSGLGRGIAVRLSQEGYAVGVGARRTDRLEEVVGDMRDYGATAAAYPCDVCKKDSVQGAIWACEAELGPVTLLVANAGIGNRTEVESFDSSEIAHVFQTNVMGAVYAVEAVLPGMLERRAGHLVAVASLAGFGGLPRTAAYSASKGAMINLFESLRLDLRHYNIDVTVINPGFVRTDMTTSEGQWRPSLLELDDGVDRIIRGILARRRSVRFPWMLSTLATASRIFPRWLYDAMAGGVRK